VDFYSLYRTTERHGGFEAVSKKRMWGVIAKEIGILSYMEGACNPLRRWYDIFLRSFEQVIRMKVAKHQSEKAAAAAAAGGTSAKASTNNRAAPASNVPTSQRAPSTASTNVAATTNQQSQQAAKRPRVEPPSTNAVTLSSAPFVPKNESKRSPERVIIDKESVDNAIRNISSQNLGDVVKGLNYLNQASMEPDQIQLNSNRNPFYIDKYPLLVVALGDLLESLNPYIGDIFPPTDYTKTLLDQSDQLYWEVENPIDDHENLQVWRTNKLL
jgi:hypothetical protein